jgi:hypothetical protein
VFYIDSLYVQTATDLITSADPVKLSVLAEHRNIRRENLAIFNVKKVQVAKCDKLGEVVAM